MKINLYYS